MNLTVSVSATSTHSMCVEVADTLTVDPSAKYMTGNHFQLALSNVRPGVFC